MHNRNLDVLMKREICDGCELRARFWSQSSYVYVPTILQQERGSHAIQSHSAPTLTYCSLDRITR
jgi:hypothetical protein